MLLNATLTLIPSYTLLFHHYLCKFPDDCSLVHSLAGELCDSLISDTDSNTETNDNLYTIINEDLLFFDQVVGFSDKFQSSKNDMNLIQTFMINYMKKFEAILFFIQATRDGNINLHLKSSENPFKFARNHLITHAWFLCTLPQCKMWSQTIPNYGKNPKSDDFAFEKATSSVPPLG